MYRKYYDGMIEVITGPMFSGKSEELIKTIRILEYGKVKTLVVKPSLDTRFSTSEIISRSGYKINTISLNTAKELDEKFIDSYQAIAIDEVQFFDEDLINFVVKQANNGKRIILSGLDMDFNGKPFGIMPQLLSVADTVKKLKAVCFSCQKAATHTFRKIDAQEQKLIGDIDEYEARCRECHLKGELKKQEKRDKNK